MIDWDSFHFLRPLWLAASLLLIPWVWLFWRRAARAGAWRRVCDAHLLRRLLVDEGGATRRWPALLVVAAWIATSLALAGPAWERLPQPAAEVGGQRALVLSLAPSMGATDVAPSRVARARFAVRDAIRALEGADVGLVIYAEEPYAVTPLTDDPDVIEAVLPVLEPGLMPGRGARLDRALDEARSLLEGAGAASGRIVVVTDGPGDAPEAALEAAERAVEAGYSVGVLGVGDSDAASLEALASAGDGRFAPVGVDAAALASVVGVPGSPLEGGVTAERGDVQVDAWRDAGRVLLWLPLLLAPLAFRRGWAGALVLVGMLAFDPTPARAGALDDWFARPDQQGARAFEAGRHEAAAELFEDSAWRAAALYRTGDYEAAVRVLEGRGDPESSYNRGNGLARSGRLEDALAAYEQVLAQEPDHQDAKHNRDLVEKLLEQQQEQQQQQSSQDSGDARDGESGSDGSDASSDESGSEQSQEGSAPSEAARDASETGDSSGSDAEAAAATEEADASEVREEDASTEGEPGDSASAAASDPARTEPGEAPPSSGTSSAELPDELPPSDTPEAPGAAEAQQPLSENDQAAEQWLRRVPDDPAGLLREKLRRRYAEKRYGARFGGSR